MSKWQSARKNDWYQSQCCSKTHLKIHKQRYLMPYITEIRDEQGIPKAMRLLVYGLKVYESRNIALTAN